MSTEGRFTSGGTITKGRLINVTRCRVAGSNVSIARAANLHQTSEDWTLRNPFYHARRSMCLVERVGLQTSYCDSAVSPALLSVDSGEQDKTGFAASNLQLPDEGKQPLQPKHRYSNTTSRDFE